MYTSTAGVSFDVGRKDVRENTSNPSKANVYLVW